MTATGGGPESQGVAVSAGRFMAIPRVLVFLRHGDEVLLLRGAPTKRIWPGLLNGLGGHVEATEDPASAAVREVEEESGIRLQTSALSLAVVVSISVGADGPGIINFIFTAESPTRDITNSGEGSLEWHRLDALAGRPLVEDLPWLLREAFSPERTGPVFARYSYDSEGRLVIETT